MGEGHILLPFAYLQGYVVCWSDASVYEGEILPCMFMPPFFFVVKGKGLWGYLFAVLPFHMCSIERVGQLKSAEK